MIDSIENRVVAFAKSGDVNGARKKFREALTRHADASESDEERASVINGMRTATTLALTENGIDRTVINVITSVD
jgi:Tfp pilus assembly protein PilF